MCTTLIHRWLINSNFYLMTIKWHMRKKRNFFRIYAKQEKLLRKERVDESGYSYPCEEKG